MSGKQRSANPGPTRNRSLKDLSPRSRKGIHTPAKNELPAKVKIDISWRNADETEIATRISGPRGHDGRRTGRCSRTAAYALGAGNASLAAGRDGALGGV